MPDLTNAYGLTLELKDFSQGQYEIYEPMLIRAVRDSTFLLGDKAGSSVTAQAVVRGASIRAAIVAGFLTGIAEGDIPNLSPRAVTWLAGKIAAHVKEVTSPPPDPN